MNPLSDYSNFLMQKKIVTQTDALAKIYDDVIKLNARLLMRRKLIEQRKVDVLFLDQPEKRMEEDAIDWAEKEMQGMELIELNEIEVRQNKLIGLS